ncbi:MAG: hypothetical protein AAGA48_36345 [Myxococcota bacterium]
MIWLLATASASITLEAPPQVGDEVVITVTDPFGEPRSGETVRVFHGPELTTEREVAIGITDGRGRIRWTPSTPGVAELQVGEEPLRIRVAPAEAPLTVMFLVAVLMVAGFGATGVALLPRRAR